MLKIRINSTHNLHLLWLVSDKGGMNVSDSFYCSLHCLRQLHSRQKKCILTKSGGSKAWKALDFKIGGSSLGALQKFTPMGAHNHEQGVATIHIEFCCGTF